MSQRGIKVVIITDADGHTLRSAVQCQRPHWLIENVISVVQNNITRSKLSFDKLLQISNARTSVYDLKKRMIIGKVWKRHQRKNIKSLTLKHL